MDIAMRSKKRCYYIGDKGKGGGTDGYIECGECGGGEVKD